MVLEFLRAEVYSPRFRQAFSAFDRGLLTNPDLTDARQNALRRAALDRHRGVYIGALPADTQWQRWALTIGELGQMRYANYVTWLRLSNDTRLIKAGAANLGLHIVENGKDITAGIRATANSIDAGEMPNGLLIAVAHELKPTADKIVIIEGHTRATAYLAAKKPPQEVTVIIGSSPAMGGWRWF
jgi:hypothetical protein